MRFVLLFCLSEFVRLIPFELNTARKFPQWFGNLRSMPPQVEEILYPAMEDFMLHIVVGKGPLARTIALNLPKFTL